MQTAAVTVCFALLALAALFSGATAQPGGGAAAALQPLKPPGPGKSAKFEIFVGSDKQFYFRIKASNGEIVLASEGYKEKSGAEKGVTAVLVAGALKDNYNQKKLDKNGKPYWTIDAGNSEIVGVSEVYSGIEAANKGIEAAQRAIGSIVQKAFEHNQKEGGSKSRVQIRDSKDKKFYYALVAANNEDVAVSETYNTRASAEEGAGDCLRTCGNSKFVKAVQDKFAHCVSPNNKILANTEQYKRAAGAENGRKAVTDIVRDIIGQYVAKHAAVLASK